MKGLKQMVAEATATPAPALPSVEVSGDAIRSLSVKMREWSGWKDSRTIAVDPASLGMPTPFAACDHITRTFVFNPDRLVLNPNRVLLTVTPFRLRQEAVLTGALLHEAGHARHSHWRPRSAEEAAANPLLHRDGATPSIQTVKLARLMEEARVEGLMARDADKIGASTLGWTMRASAAHLVPTTKMDTASSDQQLMDLITSWALRAGRQYALAERTDHELRGWVYNFTNLLRTTMVAHLDDLKAKGADIDDPVIDAERAIKGLTMMTHVDDDTGPTMIDYARLVLDLLFPETDAPMAGEGCTLVVSDDEADEEGEETGPSEPGEGEDEEGDEPGPGEGEGDESDEDAGDDEGVDAGGGEGQTDDEDGDATSSTEPSNELAEALAEMEEQAKDESEEEIEDASGGGPGGTGNGGTGNGDWRQPDKEERDIQKGAERFLREMVDATETSKVSLTDSPSSTVDGSAMAAWKAGGQHTAPNFFVRTRREVQPSPPVKVAILVDVSSSMDELQKPSSVLSWALAAAALDLQNFAGRGQQIESCLIHWGSGARVVQRNGEMMPGIKEFRCNEGTHNMHGALDLVAEEMPGFFDIGEHPVNRLLVQFTDWELYGGQPQTAALIEKALAAGVNMLTIAPRDYSVYRSVLGKILDQCKVQRGTASLLKYNPALPQQVWEQAAQVLA